MRSGTYVPVRTMVMAVGRAQTLGQPQIQGSNPFRSRGLDSRLQPHGKERRFYGPASHNSREPAAFDEPWPGPALFWSNAG